jgi:hypothetical protein
VIFCHFFSSCLVNIVMEMECCLLQNHFVCEKNEAFFPDIVPSQIPICG